MSSSQADPVRQLSLRDYLAVLRRYAVLIVVVAVLGAAAAYVTAHRQTPVYDASATVSFSDPTQALSIVGLGTSASQSPGQLASIAAETMTRSQLMSAVKQRLHTSLSVSALAGSVSATVSSNSGLLGVTAAGPTPAFAVDLANAVARELVGQDNRATRQQFASIAADVRRRIDKLGRPRPNSADSTQLSVYQDELARLAPLSSFAQSAQLAELAQPPGSPSSPNVSRSTVIGFVLGLLLGIAAAFLRNAIDRRLRGGEAIQESFDLPVVGHVRVQALGHITDLAGSAGKDSGVDREAFRILRRNVELLGQERPPRLILVTSAVPGEGKTTVAGSLGFALASAGRRTLLVDADLRRGNLTTRLGIEPSPGLTDYLAGTAAPREILRIKDLAGVDVGPTAGNGGPSAAADSGGPGASGRWLVVIPAGRPNPQAAELLGSDALKGFLEEVATQYDAVVLDSSPLLPVSDTLELLPYVDAILICARSSQTTREEAASARAVLSRYPARPTGIVVTGVRSRNAYEAYQYTAGPA